MDVIREWIITIVSVIMFITFTEIILPNSNHKKYINMVVGFLLIIVILNPIVNLLKGDFNFSDKVVATTNDLTLKTTKNLVDNTYSNNQAVMKLYKEDISKQVKLHIEEDYKYLVEHIDLEVIEDSYDSNFGMISKLDITMKVKTEEDIAQDNRIRPVEINISLDRKKDNTVEANSILINNEDEAIRNSISQYYKVLKDNVTIYVLKNN